MRKAILVTGGLGYIGSHIVLELLEAGEKVVVLDSLVSGPSPCVFPESVTVEIGDIADAALVAALVKEQDIDTVIHCAALIRVDESMREPAKYFDNNVHKTEVLMSAALGAGAKHVVFSSSASVYGNAEKIPVTEDAPLSPLSPYAETKADAEKVIAAACARYEATSVIFRYFNVSGTDTGGKVGFRVEERPSHLIRAAVTAALRGRAFTIFGNDYGTADGTCIRDFMHVKDLAAVHALAVAHLRAGGKSALYNVGDGHGFSNLQVAEKVRGLTGGTLEIAFGAKRDGDIAVSICDSSKVRTELGWKPQHDTLEEIIATDLAWIRRHL